MMLTVSLSSGRRAARFVALLSGCALAALAGCSSTSPTAPSEPVTLLVDPSGSGDHTTIQAALNEATSGDTVRVVPGTYTGAQNRDLDFGGQNIVLMAAAGRDSVVIDCEGQGRGFYLHGGEGRKAVIDGFTVTNGQANRGGGAYFQNASPTVRNVVFMGNSAEDDGGGMFLRNGASPSLTNVRFEDNTVTYFSGGGLFCDSGTAPVLTDVDFIGNEANSGGGMACIFSSPELMEVRFIRNDAGFAGGALYCGASSPTIDEATFLANSGRNGGAISLSGSSPSLSHVTMANNEAVLGAGLFCENSSLATIRTSIIALNFGSGIYCTGSSGDDTKQSCLYGNLEPDTPRGTRPDNIFLDPLFCDLGADDLKLCANSPCLPAGNQWGLRIGDKGQGCAICTSSQQSWHTPPPSPSIGPTRATTCPYRRASTPAAPATRSSCFPARMAAPTTAASRSAARTWSFARRTVWGP
jgi:hypothetical protein